MLLALQQYGQKFSPGIWPWKHLSANWQRSRHLYCLPLKKQLTCPGHTPWIANLNPPPATTRYCDWGMLQKVPSRSKERLNNSVGSREYAWLQLDNRDTIFAPVWDLLWCLVRGAESRGEGSCTHCHSLLYKTRWTEASGALLQRGAQHQPGKREVVWQIFWWSVALGSSMVRQELNGCFENSDFEFWYYVLIKHLNPSVEHI